MLKILKPADLKEELKDPKLIAKKYKYWRIRIFYSMYIGYIFFYFTRKGFTFVIPQLIKKFGYSYSDLGLLSTVLYITYGISKFVSGVLSDRSNPRYFMAIGLMLTGVSNILFGFSNSLSWFIFYCALNGWFQGWGWPPITKQLTHWYSQEERGIWWSICSTSHNIGGAIIPVIVGYYAQKFGWRIAVAIPGVMCFIVGFMLINRLRDIPRSLGLPPIEKYKAVNSADGDLHGNSSVEVSGIDRSNLSTELPVNSLSAKEILLNHLLNNHLVITMAVSCFFVYIVKTALNDWTVPFLVQNRGYDLLTAGASIIWFEIGGFLGMLFSGWITDRIFIGKRLPYIMGSSICLALTVWLFWRYNWDRHLVDFTFIGLIGFFVFGPQMLIGLAASEYVDKKAVCSANGFVSWWGYVGAAVAGYPLGLLIDYSWDWFFLILLLCSLLSCISLLPIVVKKAYILSTQSS